MGFKLMTKAMIVKNRRRVAFYSHVVETTPQDRSSRCRICQFRIILRENIADASSTTSQMDHLFQNLTEVVKFVTNFVGKICCITNKTKKNGCLDILKPYEFLLKLPPF